MKWRLLALVFLLAQATAWSQCIINATLKKICLGATTQFTLVQPTANDSAYVWDFGNNSSSTQASPTYQYPKRGTYTVTMRKYEFGGTFCDAIPLVVQVFDKPTALFLRTTAYKQCFANNSFEFTDLSETGLDLAPIKQRTIVFDDGALLNEFEPFSNTFSHSYSNVFGGKYKVVMEIKDTNNCIAQYIDSVEIFAKILDVDLKVTQTINCNRTDVALFHGFDTTKIAKIKWNMGNGDTLYAPLDSLKYRYATSKDSVFNLTLFIEDKNGCIVTITNSVNVQTVYPDSTIIITPTDTACFKNNEFRFNNKSKYTTRDWYISYMGGFKHADQTNPNVAINEKFSDCGKQQVILRNKYFDCEFFSDTFVHVYGPQAITIQTGLQPINDIQCGTGDTVYLRVADINCYYKNSQNLHHFWDFDDAFAPACTTDTKNNINVNINCRYSKDSIGVKHKYHQNNIYCYKPQYTVFDSVTGCWDMNSVTLKLNPPKAGPDINGNPPRRGVYYEKADPCLPIYTFYFNEMVPVCVPDTVWMVHDSACLPHKWSIVSMGGGQISSTVLYDSMCLWNPQGKITYGVVAANGKDALGNVCYDTAWYPLIFEYNKPLELKVNKDTSIKCNPFSATFYFEDSIRKNVDTVFWNMGDGKPIIIQTFNTLADTIIKSLTYQFKSGVYTVYVDIKDTNGCVQSIAQTIAFGTSYYYENKTPEICSKTNANLFFRPYYIGVADSSYWERRFRSTEDKEKIYWNFGDGTGWMLDSTEVFHQYNTSGIFQVTVAYKDSNANCWDTIVLPDFKVNVQQIMVKPFATNDTFFCAPTIVSYSDSSGVLNINGTLDSTKIASRIWNFGNNKPLSTLVNPGVFYLQNGSYQTRLTVTSKLGCVNDSVITIKILGPSPQFVIVNDTFGCSPLTVVFKNTTAKQLRNWIWYFNDASGSIYSTTKDTDVTFTYHKPGIYKIDLVGEDEIYNTTTGTTTNCTETFPYLASITDLHPRQVVVYANDTLRINFPDTVCPQTNFVASAGNTNKISHVTWHWGTGDTSLAALNANTTYAFDTIGQYLVRALPIITNDTQCIIPAQKNITVHQPIAHFTYDSTSYPFFQFINLSQMASRFIWDFGQPSSAFNISDLTNPTHDYGNEGLTYTVCLMAFDAFDCMDSVCKILPFRQKVIIPNVFTPDNNDEKNDAFDIDIEGWEKYELIIYNRWGNVVFEGNKDGKNNDGINWNGKNRNTGDPCPEGTYYVIFRYKMVLGANEEVYHGTVTLIR